MPFLLARILRLEWLNWKKKKGLDYIFGVVSVSPSPLVFSSCQKDMQWRQQQQQQQQQEQEEEEEEEEEEEQTLKPLDHWCK